MAEFSSGTAARISTSPSRSFSSWLKLPPSRKRRGTDGDAHPSHLQQGPVLIPASLASDVEKQLVVLDPDVQPHVPADAGHRIGRIHALRGPSHVVAVEHRAGIPRRKRPEQGGKEHDGDAARMTETLHAGDSERMSAQLPARLSQLAPKLDVCGMLERRSPWKMPGCPLPRRCHRRGPIRTTA